MCHAYCHLQYLACLLLDSSPSPLPLTQLCAPLHVPMEGRVSYQVTASAPLSGMGAPAMSVSAESWMVCVRVRSDVMPSHLLLVCCLSCTAVCTPLCLNGGTCATSGDCHCPEGWTGTSCETGQCSPSLLHTHCVDLTSWHTLLFCLAQHPVLQPLSTLQPLSWSPSSFSWSWPSLLPLPALL